ncbi:MAG: hypothetical protein ACUVQ1_04210 [Candidatus Kapaibacteriales bacterium]
MKILIVEDDTNQLDLLSDYIRKGGHEVSTSTDPLVAIELITRNFFD